MRSHPCHFFLALFLIGFVLCRIDPVLYHTVILSTRATARRFIFSIASRPSAALLVRSLSLWSGDGMGFAASWADTDLILSACTNVVRFSTVTCDTGRLQKYLGDNGTLQPRYMALHVGPLTPLEITVLPRSLTHLKLSYTRGKLLDWASIFERCAGLSHVMFDFRDYTLLYEGELEAFASHMLSVKPGALRQLVINFFLPPRDVMSVAEAAMAKVKDDRLVAISTTGALYGQGDAPVSPTGEWAYLKDGQYDAWDAAEWYAKHRSSRQRQVVSPVLTD